MKNKNLVGKQILQFDLHNKTLLFCDGYSTGLSSAFRKRVYAAFRHKVGAQELFLHGVFYGIEDTSKVLEWLKQYNQETIANWAEAFDAEFNLVVWDTEKKEVQCISDQIGAHRLYMHSENGIVTITDSLMDQVRLQAQPTLDPFGVYTFLTLYYPLDPHTLLRNTRAIGIGSTGISKGDGVEYATYYEPVKTDVDNYTSIEACVTDMDQVLREHFANRISPDSTPLVMLSGGIDSLVMLRYLSEAAPSKTEAMTFAMERQEHHELEEARIAARHYGVKHHEVIIPHTSLKDSTIQTLVESDNANLYSMAIRNWIKQEGRYFDIFRGEDARLHTPTLDWPARMGIFAHKHEFHKSQLYTTLWNLRKIFSLWPFRKGRNYIRYVLGKTELRTDFQSYVLETCLRYHFPNGASHEGSLHEQLYDATQSISEISVLEQFYRTLIAIAYRLQYSENMQWAKYASNTENSGMVMPFYHPSVNLSCNKVSLSMGLRQKLVSPTKTRSPFPLVDKYVLRKLIDGKAPDALLYRRKSAPNSYDAIYNALWNDLYQPILKEWGETLVNSLEEIENKSIVQAYRKDLLQQGANSYKDSHLAYAGRSLVYLSVLNWLCQHQSADLKSKLESFSVSK